LHEVRPERGAALGEQRSDHVVDRVGRRLTGRGRRQGAQPVAEEERDASVLDADAAGADPHEVAAREHGIEIGGPVPRHP
jgi:hypothetical protein